MSAIEHPAFRSGRITCWSSRPSTSALSAMKCTPQNTMYFAVGLRGNLRKLVAVAGEIGEANHLIPLVVVPQQNRCRTEPLARCRDPFVHAVVGKSQVIFQAAGTAGLRRDRRCFVKNQVHLVRLQSAQLNEPANGDVESTVRLQRMRRRIATPPTGMLQPR